MYYPQNRSNIIGLNSSIGDFTYHIVALWIMLFIVLKLIGVDYAIFHENANLKKET